MSIEEYEEVGGAVASILVVDACRSSWRRWDRCSRLADQLCWRLVEADDRFVWRRRLGVEIEYVLHASDVFRIYVGNAPHLLAPRLNLLLSESTPHGLVGQRRMLGHRNEGVGEQLHRPTRAPGWRFRAGHRHEQRFLFSCEYAAPTGARLVVEHDLEISLNKALLRPVYSRRPHSEHFSDILVPKP